jgi:hypothetical protein
MDAPPPVRYFITCLGSPLRHLLQGTCEESARLISAGLSFEFYLDYRQYIAIQTIAQISPVVHAAPTCRAGQLAACHQPANTNVIATKQAPATPQPQTTAGSSISFHDILSVLNPLQYIPVVGSIYRAVTGDQIPEAVRRIGSLVVSTLLGGPIGAMISIGTTIAEKATGIDLDKTEQALLTGHQLTPQTQADPVIAKSVAPSGPVTAQSVAPSVQPSATAAQQPAANAWSPAHLAAEGVTVGADGSLAMANVTGADVLNTLELSHIRDAYAASTRTRDAGRLVAVG